MKGGVDILFRLLTEASIEPRDSNTPLKGSIRVPLRDLWGFLGFKGLQDPLIREYACHKSD